MYGKGNYASGPPFQQRPPFQQGPPSLRPPIYEHGPIPPPPPPPPPPFQSSGMQPGQQYVNTRPPPPPPPSMQVHGSSQVQQYYSNGQHHSQWAQNTFQVRPEIPTSGTGHTVQSSLPGQGPPRGPVGGQAQHDPSLPLDQPSKSLRPPPYNSYMYPMSQCPQFPPMVPPPPLPASLPQSLPHPLPLPPGASASPAHEVQLSAVDLDQSCSNDSRRHEKVSDPVGRVTTLNQSVDNLSAHENSLENGGATGSSFQHHSVTDADTCHSPSNSDMDMEDDFTHPAEVASVCLSKVNHGFSSEPVTDSQTAVEQDPVSVGPDISRDHESGSRISFQISDSSILLKNSEPQVSSMTDQSSCPDNVFNQCSVSIGLAEKDFKKPADGPTKKCSPLNLLGNYSSDDSAENSEAHVRAALAAEQEVATSVPRDCAATGTHIENNPSDDHEPKNLLNSENGFDPLVASSGVSSDLLKSNVKSQSDIPGPDVGASSARELEDSTDNKTGNQKASKIGSSLEINKDYTRGGISQKEVLKSSSDMSKVDEFGRLVREDHSDNDSGDSPSFTRRRSKRGRSRSWSRSPIRGRSRSRSRSPRGRRRSPWRRRGRHGRSRSTSPKRRRSRSKSRSRSRSPSYRHGGEIGNEKTRRHKAQLPECLNHIRGKCYRGSSCRYLHNESDKTTDRSRSSHMKQQSHDESKTFNVYGDTDPLSPNRSVHEHQEHDESKNFKQEVLSTGEGRKLTEEPSDGPRNLSYTETHIGIPPDISNCQTQLIEGQAVAENSWQTSESVQSQLPSSKPSINKDSLSTSYGHLMSTEQPFTSESTMPQSYLQELPSSVGNQSSNVIGGNSSPSTNQIPGDYNLILQHSQFPPPSNASWNSLPPPPPLPFPFPNNSMGNTASGLPSSQFQQMHPRTDLRYQPSTGVGLPGMYSQIPEPHKSFHDANRFGPRIMPVMSKPMDQVHGPPSHMHPYMHHSPYGLHKTPVDVPAHYGEPGNAFNHFPPLAPILNEPLTSNYSSNIASQRKDIPCGDIHGTPYSSKHTSAGGLLAPAQYDPHSDSMEPSSSSMKKLDISHKLPTGDSDVLRTSGSNQLLYMDGNIKHKGNGDREGFLLPENDEYGETADAEAGDVEDGSTSNPQIAADISAEEDEINHVKASGKTKKDKDSKSMKIFKIAIADFVKEVLKLSWRQGNMSKEAFKTIVKKTVDKVSVATGKHHIPKSREKIDHYINSQQRKLTKLVMGYVDKYVKA